MQMFYPQNDFLMDGSTALMGATKNGHYEVVEFLLDAGASLNPVNVLGHSALFIAVINNHVNIARLLLERGSSTNLIDLFGKKPIDYAQGEIINLL
jgi:ankyrin repeat protein